MAEKQHWNGHRKNKRSFQAMLNPEEGELFDYVKQHREIEKNKDLLITLLEEEAKRIQEAK